MPPETTIEDRESQILGEYPDLATSGPMAYEPDAGKYQAKLEAARELESIRHPETNPHNVAYESSQEGSTSEKDLLDQPETFDLGANKVKLRQFVEDTYSPEKGLNQFETLDRNYNERLDKIHQFRILALSNKHSDSPAFKKIFQTLDIEEERTNVLYKSESERMGASVYRGLPPAQKDIMGRMLQSGEVAPKDALLMLNEHNTLDKGIADVLVETSEDDPIRKHMKATLFGSGDNPGLLEQTKYGTTRVRAGVSSELVNSTLTKFKSLTKPTKAGGDKTRSSGGDDSDPSQRPYGSDKDIKGATDLGEWEVKHAKLEKENISDEAKMRSLRAGALLYSNRERNDILTSNLSKEEKESELAKIEEAASVNPKGYMDSREGIRKSLQVSSMLERSLIDPQSADQEKLLELAKEKKIHTLGLSWGKPTTTDGSIADGTIFNFGDGIPTYVPIKEEDRTQFDMLTRDGSPYRWDKKRGFVRTPQMRLRENAYYWTAEHNEDPYSYETQHEVVPLTEEDKKLDEYAKRFSDMAISQHNKLAEAKREQERRKEIKSQFG